MDSIEQLRAMRNAAKARIEAMPDFKLMVKLTTLIEELEEIFSADASGNTGEQAGEGEAEEEVDLGLPPATAAPPVQEQPRQGLHKWRSSLGPAPVREEPAEEPQPVEEIPGGLAQAEIEETMVSEPTEEVGEGIEEQLEAGLPSGELYNPLHEDESSNEAEESALDSDEALKQAMAELEADLDRASLDPKASRFRYGNSS